MRRGWMRKKWRIFFSRNYGRTMNILKCRQICCHLNRDQYCDTLVNFLMSAISPSQVIPKERMAELAQKFGIKEEDIQVYIETFQSIDMDRDGQITPQELQQALSDLGYSSSEEQALRMVNLADENNDGQVDLPEFLRMVIRTAIWLQPDVEEEILAAFKAFDRNNDGYITTKELHETMSKMGQSLSKKEAASMLKAMDINKDGKISYKEFMTVWTEFMSGMQLKG